VRGWGLGGIELALVFASHDDRRLWIDTPPGWDGEQLERHVFR